MASSRRFFGYTARGVPYGPDDGTIAPAATLASIVFAPEMALAAIRHFLRALSGDHQGIPAAERIQSDVGGNGSRCWVSEGYFGLDQGIVVLMIENYRSQLIWKLMRQCPYIGNGTA